MNILSKKHLITANLFVAFLLFILTLVPVASAQTVSPGQASHLRITKLFELKAPAQPKAKQLFTPLASPKDINAVNKVITDSGCSAPPVVSETTRNIPAIASAFAEITQLPKQSNPTQGSVVKEASCNLTHDLFQILQESRSAEQLQQNAALALWDQMNITDPEYANSVKDALIQILDAVGVDSRRIIGGCVLDPKAGVYRFGVWLPTVGKNCTNASINNFYDFEKSVTPASKVQYLYGVSASSNAVSADLVTATFSPGFQLDFASTVTTGPSTPQMTSSGQSTNTDDPATTISKLESGGDFSLQGSFPLVAWAPSNHPLSAFVYVVPRAGFTVSGLGSQNTITQGTDFNVFYPIETYVQTVNIDRSDENSVTLFADARTGGEFLDSGLAQKLGYAQNFSLDEFAFGVDFKESYRISFQRFVGPNGTNVSTGANSNFGTWRVVLQLKTPGRSAKKTSNGS